ncbi:hypothetical protein AM592_08040 [Bacillus gobiensis]|uniref:Uncharacterized protein n=1 Tax=Bacillus gobiensis TaxID=1441095 RepID=A0A0M4FJC9_9BACI|nr:hypothetical protein AM592_08040 [Bacillus gobiensis]
MWYDGVIGQIYAYNTPIISYLILDYIILPCGVIVKKKIKFPQKRKAKELGIESVRVIIKDISEDDVPSRIINSKLGIPELSRKSGISYFAVLRGRAQESERKTGRTYRLNISANLH